MTFAEVELELHPGDLLLAQLTIEEESGLLRACLAGEVDMSNAAQLRAQLDGLAAPQLVLDLSELVFFDSSGIRAGGSSAAR
jgi:anti-anti-sigma factor